MGARNERAKVTTPCILSVCLADFLFAIVLLPIQASRFMSRDWEARVGPEDGMICQVYPIILFTVQGASLLSLMLITLNQALVLFFSNMSAVPRWVSTYLVANPTIFILSNRGFLIAVQMLPQNLVGILPNC